MRGRSLACSARSWYCRNDRRAVKPFVAHKPEAETNEDAATNLLRFRFRLMYWLCVAAIPEPTEDEVDNEIQALLPPQDQEWLDCFDRDSALPVCALRSVSGWNETSPSSRYTHLSRGLFAWEA